MHDVRNEVHDARRRRWRTNAPSHEQDLYGMCRGLSRYDAMHLIVERFSTGVYDRSPVELVRETLSAAVERKPGIGE